MKLADYIKESSENVSREHEQYFQSAEEGELFDKDHHVAAAVHTSYDVAIIVHLVGYLCVMAKRITIGVWLIVVLLIINLFWR